jgi:hypothetical protein
MEGCMNGGDMCVHLGLFPLFSKYSNTLSLLYSTIIYFAKLFCVYSTRAHAAHVKLTHTYTHVHSKHRHKKRHNFA